MGCAESRCWSLGFSDRQTRNQPVMYQSDNEAKAFLYDAMDRKSPACPAETLTLEPNGEHRVLLACSPAGKPVLDFAQRLSEDIVAEALLLCWTVEMHYNELPFIDSECDYVV